MGFDFAGEYPARRMRRMRRDDFSRRLVREHRLTADDLIYPVFVLDGAKREEPVASLPGRFAQDPSTSCCAMPNVARSSRFRRSPCSRWSAGEQKTPDGAEAWNPEGLVPRAVRALKERFPELGVITDVALDPYTSHGQDGLIDATGYVVNDETVAALVTPGAVPGRGRSGHGRAVGHDGRAHRRDPRGARRRKGTSGRGSSRTAAKYASSFYGPFRDAVGSAAHARRRQTSTPIRWIPPTRTRRCARCGSTSRRAPTW